MKASTNKRGDIVTFDGIEYRLRQAGYFRRMESGVLVPTLWRDIPRQVRDAFTERTF